jgi:hypothetical protein
LPCALGLHMYAASRANRTSASSSIRARRASKSRGDSLGVRRL